VRSRCDEDTGAHKWGKNLGFLEREERKKRMEIKLWHGAIAPPTRHLLKEWLINNGARNQSKTEGYQINGEEYKHLQIIAKHFVKERLISTKCSSISEFSMSGMPDKASSELRRFLHPSKKSRVI
jgi:hypothetical protein